MIKEKISQYINKLKPRLAIDKERVKIQFKVVYSVFAIVSLVMSIMNYFDNWIVLFNLTFGFFIANLINYILTYNSKSEYIARILFAIESLAMFTCFIIFGEPEGFSAIWICLLPIESVLLYRSKYGTIISLIMFSILVFLLWTPIGNSIIYSGYTKSFLERFPVLYLSFYAIGIIFEIVRWAAQDELNNLKDKYAELSYKDQLTGILNNTAYLEEIDKINKKIASGENIKFKVIFFDVNGLKDANDKYGHKYGTQLIIDTAKGIRDLFPNDYCYRVGGDEFITIVAGSDYENAEQILQEFDSRYAYQEIKFEGKKLVLSVASGIAEYKKDSSFNAVYQRADKTMYQHKKALKEKYGIWTR